MSASKAKAGEAYVEISTRNGLLNKGLAAAQASMRRLAAMTNTLSATMGKGFASVGGALASVGSAATSVRGMLAGIAAASGMGVIVKGFADAAGSVEDMTKRTGLAAEEIGGLGYAAQLSGASIGTVEAAIRKMQRAGISSGRGAMADFRTMADVIAAIPDPAKRAAEAMKVFGKSGTQLLPMLENGSAGLDQMMRDAQRLGIVMSAADVAMGDQLGDTLDQLWATLGGLSNQIGAALAPSLIALANDVIEIAGSVASWISRNRELLGTLLSISTYTTMAQQGIAMIGASMQILGDTSAAMIGWIQTQWQSLTDYVMPIINGIATAMMSGQWAAAGKIAMLGLEQAMRIGVQPLYDLYVDFYSFIAQGAVDAVTAIANVFAGIPTSLMNGFSTAITWLVGAWDEAVTSIQNAFSTVVTWLTGTWDRTVNSISKSLLYLYSLFDRSVNYEADARKMDEDATKRSEDRQKSLDALTAQREADAAKRADQRQRELDRVTNQRTEDLTRANQQRMQYGAGVAQGIRDQASENKSAFDARIRELGDEIATTIQDVNRNAAQREGASVTSPGAMPAKPELPTLPDAMQVATDTATKTTGTFSGFGAGLLGTGTSALDKLAKETTAQTKLLSAIADNTSADDSLVLE